MVFLQHGLLCSSAAWVIGARDRALGKRVFSLLWGVNQGCGLLLARGLEKREPGALVNTQRRLNALLLGRNVSKTQSIAENGGLPPAPLALHLLVPWGGTLPPPQLSPTYQTPSSPWLVYARCRLDIVS